MRFVQWRTCRCLANQDLILKKSLRSALQVREELLYLAQIMDDKQHRMIE
jgi:hypothetical protein